MDLFDYFLALPAASSAADFSAIPFGGRQSDYLAKSIDGSPVFLLHDASLASYSPSLELKYVSVHFHSTCRVTTAGGEVEDQFAVVCCNVSAPDLQEIFVRSVAAAAEQLPLMAGTSELQRCIETLLELFRVLGRPSNREVAGLWAELFVILQSKNVAGALQSWHSDQFERFDFSWPSGCLEVKAKVGDVRQHEFALEQLQTPIGGVGYVASIMLQPLSGGVGIVDLAKAIERVVPTQPVLRQKLWEHVTTALGSEFAERLDRKFDSSYAARSLVTYEMRDVPAPQQPSDPRITGVRFRVDMTNVNSSLSGDARDVLSTLFVE